MKKDLSKAFRFIRFGMCVNKAINMGGMMVFLILGFAGEVYYISTGKYALSGTMDLCAFILMAALAFPAQFLVTSDIAHAVQTSPYKKSIQTKMFAEVSIVMYLMLMTALVLLRIIGVAMNPELATTLYSDLSLIGIMAAVILIFTTVMYKFFWIALVVLYIVVFGMSAGTTFLSFMEGCNILKMQLPVAVNVIIAYAFVVLGGGIGYLLSVAFYKRPFSKAAFGALMSKYVQ